MFQPCKEGYKIRFMQSYHIHQPDQLKSCQYFSQGA